MKICIKDREFNPSFISMYGEDKAREQGYTIFEVPEGYEDCAFEDFDKNGFNIELYSARKLREQNQHKVIEAYEYLNSTDYIDNKFTEALVTNNTDLLEELKIKYAEQLVKRQEAREFIDKNK